MIEVFVRETVGFVLSFKSIDWARAHLSDESWEWDWDYKQLGCGIIMKFKHEEDAIAFKLACEL